MKITLQNAVSLDGFIAREDGSTEWVQDLGEWEQLVRKHGNLVLGRTSFEEIQNELVPGVAAFVLSAKDGVNNPNPDVIFVHNLDELLSKAAEHNITELLLCGGAQTNAAFAAAGLIDEMILDVHPLLLGTGKRLLGDFAGELNLKLLETVPHQKFTTQRYQVLNRSE